jgi:4-hydroxy-tetrahydrodipicolinate reductase
LTAAKWLINKKPGLYSMRDLLNFKWIIKKKLKS